MITGATPSSIARGSPLAISGTDLGSPTAVTIGAVAQTMDAATATSVSVTVAQGTPTGAQLVVVTTASGSSAPFGVTVLTPLAVTGAVATGPTAVQVQFSREVDAATVDFADFAITGVGVSAAAAAGATVTLTTSAQVGGEPYIVAAGAISDLFGNGLTGSASAAFSGFTPTTPLITLVSPAQLVRGFSVTIDGSRLANATGVTVGGVDQTFVTNSSTQISVSALAASTPLGEQPVVVTTADGASAPYSVAVLAQFAVVAASATGTTEVVVTFTRDVDAASVLPARFTIAGLMVSAATAAGNTVTLTTSAQTRRPALHGERGFRVARHARHPRARERHGVRGIPPAVGRRAREARRHGPHPPAPKTRRAARFP